MVDNFNGMKLCREYSQLQKSGCIQIDSNGVTWNVFIANGHLQYATHSLQTLDTLTHHLSQLGHRLPREELTRLQAILQTQIDSAASGLPLYEAIQHLQQQGTLAPDVAKAVTLEISKEALEYVLWLQQARYTWLDQASHHLEIAPLSDILNQLESRLKTWQALTPGISSPYQQPHCPEPAKLTQTVPNGMLNQSLLSMLAQLMQGKSIIQLSGFLKQDSLKVAQLLHPYIQQRIFTLNPPAAPYNKLPTVPIASALNTFSPKAASAQAATPSPQPKAPQTIHKIVCIDDSPAMLETIQGYLGSEGFEVATVENPMESMSTLFSMKPDLILMDVSMPGINGNRLCEILRRSAAFKKLPIIMVSGNTSVLDKAKSESSGATAYLTKPFSKSDLLSIVETHLSVSVPA